MIIIKKLLNKVLRVYNIIYDFLQDLFLVGFHYSVVNFKINSIFKKKIFLQEYSFFNKIKNLKNSKKNKKKICEFFELYYSYLFHRFYGSFEETINFREKILKLDISNILNVKKYDKVKHELFFENNLYSKILGSDFKNHNYYHLSILFLENFNELSDNYNRNFYNYIKNQKIKFIGPGSKTESKKNLNDDSVKVTVNASHKIVSDLRPHIVYFNNKRSREHPEQVANSIVNSDWTVFKSKGFYDICKKNNIIKNNARYLDDFQLSNFFGDYNYLALILMDLLIHGAKHVYIESIDFFTLKNPYNTDYRDKKNYNKDTILKSNRLHDPFKTYLFIKHLYKKKYVSGDQYFEQVIQMDNNEYAKLLDQNYA